MRHDPRIRRFYEDILRFPLRHEPGPQWIAYRMASNILALTERGLMFDDPPTPAGALSLQLAFRVPPGDVDRCAAELQKRVFRCCCADLSRRGYSGMLLSLPGFSVRDWQSGDAPALAQHGNDRRIWLNMRDAFPHPFTQADAEAFIAAAANMHPRSFFAIAIGDQAIGGIGYTLHRDVERISAEIGYWLGTAYWGRGIMTAALRAVTAHAFAQHPELRRIYAVPYAWSTASARVLEKAGYRCEGRMRQSAIKDGRVTDQLLYSILRDEVPPAVGASRSREVIV